MFDFFKKTAAPNPTEDPGTEMIDFSEKLPEALTDDWVNIKAELDENDFYDLGAQHDLDPKMLKRVIAQMKPEKLAEIKNSDDLIKLVQEASPLTPISEECRKLIKQSADNILRNQKIDSAIRIAMAFSMAAGLAYFGGPIGMSAAQTIFTKGYGLLFGIPAKYSLGYWLAYWPMQKHAAALGYQYGPPVLSMAGGFVGHRLKSAADAVGSRMSRLWAKQEAPVADETRYGHELVNVRRFT